MQDIDKKIILQFQTVKNILAKLNGGKLCKTKKKKPGPDDISKLVID